MTLSSELLPAMQHYALLAAALALFSLSLTHVKRPFSVWVWITIVVLPFIQMAWSLWETICEVVAVESTRQPPLGSHAAWIVVVQALVHGLAILFVLVMVPHIARRSRNELLGRRRREPTIGHPRK